MQRSNWLLVFFFLFLYLFSETANAQIITPLQSGTENDSSYYHLTKIGENEYWACGEYGIITMFDTLGHFHSVPIQTEGYNILKMERAGDIVLIATDNSRLLKYNLISKEVQKVDFKKYKNRCFYDFLFLPEGKIALCGGATGISKGQRKTPHGFIAITDTSFSEPKLVWKSYRKFVWSLVRKKDGTVTAAVFNGINSSLISTNDFSQWKKSKKIKGLVHELILCDSAEKISYVGAGGLHYKRNGVYSLDGQKRVKSNNSGCFWSQKISMDDQIICGQKGQVILFNHNNQKKVIQFPTMLALYDLSLISNQKLLVVGHGKCAFILDFTQN